MLDCKLPQPPHYILCLLGKRQVNSGPRFQISTYQVSVPENEPPYTHVINLKAVDPDDGEAGRLEYSMKSPQDKRSDNYFRIDAKTGSVSTIQQLDRELMDTHVFLVFATDNGTPKRSTSSILTITVSDKNDHRPVFEQKNYKINIRENVEVGFEVMTIRATDGDNVAFYNLKALAVDRGLPPLKAVVSVNISVLDINDNAPVFEKDELFIYVEENSQVGSVVAQITATDPDEGTNAQIMYQIVEGNIPEVFQLDIFNGDLIALTDLDYETKTEYIIVVQATSAPLVSRATVHIRLVDMNDNVPVLQNFEIIFNNYVTNNNRYYCR
uniref:Cadherin domain-containing protein n=1 Tax=Xiphophorus couchianus TaxID=32473 RepID=A0A3B5MGD3_9TELE